MTLGSQEVALNTHSMQRSLMQNELLSLVQAAAVVKTDPSMISRWLKNVEKFRADPLNGL